MNTQLDHGIIAGAQPPLGIAAGAAVIWIAESDGLMTGTAGWVLYEVQDPGNSMFEVAWSNPYIGTNKYTQTRRPGSIASGTALDMDPSNDENCRVTYTCLASQEPAPAPPPPATAPAPIERTAPPVAAAPGGASTSVVTASDSGRQDMLDLIEKWMPTSLSYPKVPAGESQDLLAKSGWTVATGKRWKQTRDDNNSGKNNPKLAVATSCGDVLSALLTLWKSDFVGAFGIRDEVIVLDAQGKKHKKPGAIARGFYERADAVKRPKPGDILVLKNGFGKKAAGTVGHVCVLVGITGSDWATADGGGGGLPEQTAMVNTRPVTLDKNNIPLLVSPTDKEIKELDGWIVLDRLTRHP